MRSIRFSLKHRGVFTDQVRAILRAGAGSQVRIMFPMISSLDEFLEARAVVAGCIESLRKDHVPFNDAPQVGFMVEIPSVLSELAAVADFMSIGTNDLIQYVLAVDRTNEKVADLYLPHHPSILRALKFIADTAAEYHKPLSICGDMVHEVKYLKFLLGIGIRRFSLNPLYIPRLQKAIQALALVSAREYADALLKERHAHKIEKILEENMSGNKGAD